VSTWTYHGAMPGLLTSLLWFWTSDESPVHSVRGVKCPISTVNRTIGRETARGIESWGMADFHTIKDIGLNRCAVLVGANRFWSSIAPG
jgi:hypothetical protein